VLIEGSAVKNPRDWKVTLNSKNLTRRGVKDRTPDLVLDDLPGKRNAKALHAIDAYVTGAMRWSSNLIVFFH